MNFDYTYAHADISHPVPPSIKKNYVETKLIEKVIFEDVAEFSDVIYIENMMRIHSRLRAIEHEYSRKLIFFNLSINNAFSEILVECCRSLMQSAFSGENDNINSILTYIHENYQRTLTNKEIGDYFNFHPNYISKLIKSSTGMPLHQYLIHVKISHATEMLENSNLRIGEIASKCGFGDIYYFSRCFKKKIGISPIKYKGR